MKRHNMWVWRCLSLLGIATTINVVSAGNILIIPPHDAQIHLAKNNQVYMIDSSGKPVYKCHCYSLEHSGGHGPHKEGPDDKRHLGGHGSNEERPATHPGEHYGTYSESHSSSGSGGTVDHGPGHVSRSEASSSARGPGGHTASYSSSSASGPGGHTKSLSSSSASGPGGHTKSGSLSSYYNQPNGPNNANPEPHGTTHQEGYSYKGPLSHYPDGSYGDSSEGHPRDDDSGRNHPPDGKGGYYSTKKYQNHPGESEDHKTPTEYAPGEPGYSREKYHSGHGEPGRYNGAHSEPHSTNTGIPDGHLYDSPSTVDSKYPGKYSGSDGIHGKYGPQFTQGEPGTSGYPGKEGYFSVSKTYRSGNKPHGHVDNVDESIENIKYGPQAEYHGDDGPQGHSKGLITGQNHPGKSDDHKTSTGYVPGEPGYSWGEYHSGNDGYDSPNGHKVINSVTENKSNKPGGPGRYNPAHSKTHSTNTGIPDGHLYDSPSTVDSKYPGKYSGSDGIHGKYGHQFTQGEPGTSGYPGKEGYFSVSKTYRSGNNPHGHPDNVDESLENIKYGPHDEYHEDDGPQGHSKRLRTDHSEAFTQQQQSSTTTYSKTYGGHPDEQGSISISESYVESPPNHNRVPYDQGSPSSPHSKNQLSGQSDGTHGLVSGSSSQWKSDYGHPEEHFGPHKPHSRTTKDGYLQKQGSGSQRETHITNDHPNDNLGPEQGSHWHVQSTEHQINGPHGPDGLGESPSQQDSRSTNVGLPDGHGHPSKSHHSGYSPKVIGRVYAPGSNYLPLNYGVHGHFAGTIYAPTHKDWHMYITSLGFPTAVNLQERSETCGVQHSVSSLRNRLNFKCNGDNRVNFNKNNCTRRHSDRRSCVPWNCCNSCRKCFYRC